MSRRLIRRPEGAEEAALLDTALHPPPEEPGAVCARVADWDHLLGLAELHGMAPLVWRRVLDAPENAVPSSVREDARVRFKDNLRRNLTLTARLTKLLELLRGEKIHAVPYKGPDLAERGYGDAGLRRYLDLDILVAEHDALRAREVLLASGFRPERGLPAAWLRPQLRTQCDFKFFAIDGGEAVEVHWDLTPRYLAMDADAPAMLERAVSLPLAGAEIRVLAPEDVVSALSVHGMKHLWERLGWICDLARWIHAHPDLDWERMEEGARERGLLRVLRVGLLLAADLMQQGVPAAARGRAAADHPAVSLARRLGSGLFGRPPSMSAATRLHLQSRERSGDRLRYLRRLALCTTHRDWTTFPLPERMFALRGAWRPVRLLLDSTLGRLRGR